MVIIAIAAVLIIGGIAIGTGLVNQPGDETQTEPVVTGTDDDTLDAPSTPLATDLQSAKADAIEVAKTMGDLVREVQALNESESEEGVDKYAEYSAKMSGITKDCLARIANDRQIVQDAIDAGATDLELVKAAMANIEEMALFDQAMDEIQTNYAASEDADAQGQYNSLKGKADAYRTMDTPTCMQDPMDDIVKTYETYCKFLEYYLGGRAINDTLDSYSIYEIEQWMGITEGSFTKEFNGLEEKQYDLAAEIIAGDRNGQAKPSITLDVVSEISPNLYPNTDSAVNVCIEAVAEQDVLIEAQVEGFTQQYSQKTTLMPGINYFQIKPAVLPGLSAKNLDDNRTTQLNIKISDIDTGKVLEQASKNVELNSIYDFEWANDEFGITAMFDILAWMRPQADEVEAINRAAADYMEQWTNGELTAITGYLYGEDWSTTLVQVAAIQKAISDAGVRYINGAYSFAKDQRVLTPDAVVQMKQAICIESSLLMASCLQSAGMHPMLIITPGHAQIAIETSENSGAYFLIETTELPYEGVDMNYSYDDVEYYRGLLAEWYDPSGAVDAITPNGTADEWSSYFDSVADDAAGYGTKGIFVVDCNLQQVLGIQGLESA